MDGLRWLLLLFGVLVIAGVYFYSRRERERVEKPAGPKAPARRVEPSLDGQLSDPDAATVDEDEVAEVTEVAEVAEEEDRPRPARKQKIVTLRLVARGQASFPGDELILSLRGAGLRHGKFGIFHRYEGDDEKRTVFSAASLVEPGSFDLADIQSQVIPGISLFMVLPGPIDGAKAFDQMMTAGRALARTLNAELLDESGSTMSVQRERYLREEIIQYQHGIKVA